MTQNPQLTCFTALLLSSLLISGCSTSKEEMLPAGDHTMLELWNGDDGSGSLTRQAASARDTLRRPITEDERFVANKTDSSYSRAQESEITQQFPRLPNPDMVMYIYPHLADGNTPVPGYSTVFPFYKETQYAMPGERTEAL
ncbi:TIGR03751 family conjugal transfer lipoprotein [Pantoea cypripedii]|uniref:TIGR03751 family conjugal transfer lipoprotein n=1 Tax=Pantoea cypripedii TaxID=55209 RepID=UPI002FCA569E